MSVRCAECPINKLSQVNEELVVAVWCALALNDAAQHVLGEAAVMARAGLPDAHPTATAVAECYEMRLDTKCEAAITPPASLPPQQLPSERA